MDNSETDRMLDIVHLEQLKQWRGRTETRSDVVTATPVAVLAATLDRADAVPQPGDAPGGAVFCLRFRCRGACGRAGASSSITPCECARR